jgi:hypothetical protein
MPTTTVVPAQPGYRVVAYSDGSLYFEPLIAWLVEVGPEDHKGHRVVHVYAIGLEGSVENYLDDRWAIERPDGHVHEQYGESYTSKEAFLAACNESKETPQKL